SAGDANLGELSLAGKCARVTEHCGTGLCVVQRAVIGRFGYPHRCASVEIGQWSTGISSRRDDAGTVGGRDGAGSFAAGEWQQEPGCAAAGTVAECAALSPIEDRNCG